MKIKKVITLISLIIFTSCITGCSTKSWYEGGQISAEQNCHNQPLSAQEQCLKNINNKTYKEYKKDY